MDNFEICNNMEIKNSLRVLAELYPDCSVKNDMQFFSSFEGNKQVKLIGQSLKRNSFEGFTIINSIIENSAFSGSSFFNFTFLNNMINGNSFVSSNFENFNIKSDVRVKYCSNNFSESFFYNCCFSNLSFQSSTWLNSIVNYSKFEECEIASCTLEGVVFRNCQFKNVNMANTNLDYMIIDNSKLDNVFFPFYQFAYIIGSANYLQKNNDNNKILFVSGKKTLTVREYKNHINDLINYYINRGEFFPASNLYIALGDVKSSRKNILQGIHKSLQKNDFRLIKHFCKLGMFHSLIDYRLTHEIKNELDRFLNQNKFSIEELNHALIKVSEINSILNEKSTGKTFLQLELNTNIDRNDEKNQDKIEALISDCRYILQNPIFNIEGHTISEVNYCPISILLTVLGSAAELATIASALQCFFSQIRTHKHKSTRTLAKEICKKYENIVKINIDDRINFVKSEVKNSMLEIKKYKGIKSGKKYDDFIDSVTQKIIGDVDNILDRDMLVFKVENH